jgi:ornithine cyclodeaminase
MRAYDRQETFDMLPFRALARSIDAMLQAKKTGKAVAPARMTVQMEDKGTLLIMPASQGSLAVVKLVTVHPDNYAVRRMPTIQGEVVVIDTDDGSRLGVLDGMALTARRTAALTMLAARKVAPDPYGPILVIGAGAQAREHLRAFREALVSEKAYICSRHGSSARELAREAKTWGLDAEVVSSPAEAMDKCTVIITATTSRTPVIGPEVRDDAFIAAIGSFTPDAAELPPELVRKSRLFVDTMEGAKEEAGDFIQASVDWSTVMALEDVEDKDKLETGPVIFKSVGHALWDLAAAKLAFGR